MKFHIRLVGVQEKMQWLRECARVGAREGEGRVCSGVVGLGVLVVVHLGPVGRGALSAAVGCAAVGNEVGEMVRGFQPRG